MHEDTRVPRSPILENARRGRRFFQMRKVGFSLHSEKCARIRRIDRDFFVRPENMDKTSREDG